MTLPASGAIDFNSIQTEFGGTNPIGLNEYYNGGSYVPNYSNNANIPTSGSFSINSFYNTSVNALNKKAIFGYGYTGSYQSLTNLVSNTGVVATDVTGVGTARYSLASAGYGGDKAIFGYGYNGTSSLSITNLVSNTGVVGTDVTGVGTARYNLAAAGYGS